MNSLLIVICGLIHPSPSKFVIWALLNNGYKNFARFIPFPRLEHCYALL